MAVSTLIVGSVGLFLAGFAAWYVVRRLRLASSFVRVPVKSGRPRRLLREGVELGRDPE
jgi:hypothetical protein